MKDIYIIIPTYNEEENILQLINKIRIKIPISTICIVDDSKESKIKKIIKKKKIKKIFYFHRKNLKGRGSAVIYGFKKLYKKHKQQIFIEMDADFSHKPSELRKNIIFFKKNKCDLLISSRYLKDSIIINWPILRRIFSKISNLFAEFILGLGVTDYTNGFRIYSSAAVNLIIKKCGNIGDGFIVLSEILVTIHVNKLKILETNSIFVNRVRGKSSANLKLVVQSLIGLFKLFFSKRKYIWINS